MRITKNLLVCVIIAALVGALAFTTAASDVIAQNYEEVKKRTDSSGSSSDKNSYLTNNSLIQRISMEGNATLVDDEEDTDQGEIDENVLEAGNDTEEESEGENEYTSSFRAEECTFSSTGRNAFFILEPNYQLVLAGEDAGEAATQTITILNETREVNGTETRVVEERSTVDDELVEISRNFFAICEETNSVFYFGEDVDFYENGTISSHEGAWIAGENDNRPGVIMPGTTLLGARYYQEIAPGVAIGEAEIVDMGEEVQTAAGNFTDTVTIRETTPLEPDTVGLKYYSAGVGMIQDEELKLERYGFTEE